MIDVKQYIESGIVDEYCLGLLSAEEAAAVRHLAEQYAEIQQEIDNILQSLELYATEESPEPRITLRNRVLDTLSQLGEELPPFSLTNLPLLNPFSDAEQWQKAVASITPDREFRNIYSHTLRNDDQTEQFLVWVKIGITPEDHHQERESFLILEGTCECELDDETIRLTAGDYLEIPLDVKHNVRVISPTPIKAIIQRLKAA